MQCAQGTYSSYLNDYSCQSGDFESRRLLNRDIAAAPTRLQFIVQQNMSSISDKRSYVSDTFSNQNNLLTTSDSVNIGQNNSSS